MSRSGTHLGANAGLSIHRAVSAPGLTSDIEAECEADVAEYTNPHDKSSRWYLVARIFALRQGASLGYNLQHRAAPGAPSPSKTLWLDSTLGEWQGRELIKVDVWTPWPERVVRKRQAVINFHGGGFVLGQGTDDARWANVLMDELDAVVFSVNYRLAPAYPFPKPVEDCADAILQIAARAEEFNIDPSRLLVTGFSAGANLSLASWLVLQRPEMWNYQLNLPKPGVVGFALFYPLLDATIGRARKRARCLRPDMTLPNSLTNLFDAAYIYPPLPRGPRTDWRLSPGLMSDELVDLLPRTHLCLCEYDMLLPEGLTFAERMNSRGKQVSVRVVAKEKHAWDKPPPVQPKKSMFIEYKEAANALKTCVSPDQDKQRHIRPSATLVRANTEM